MLCITYTHSGIRHVMEGKTLKEHLVSDVNLGFDKKKLANSDTRGGSYSISNPCGQDPRPCMVSWVSFLIIIIAFKVLFRNRKPSNLLLILHGRF